MGRCTCISWYSSHEGKTNKLIALRSTDLKDLRGKNKKKEFHIYPDFKLPWMHLRLDILLIASLLAILSFWVERYKIPRDVEISQMSIDYPHNEIMEVSPGDERKKAET